MLSNWSSNQPEPSHKSTTFDGTCVNSENYTGQFANKNRQDSEDLCHYTIINWMINFPMLLIISAREAVYPASVSGRRTLHHGVATYVCENRYTVQIAFVVYRSTICLALLVWAIVWGIACGPEWAGGTGIAGFVMKSGKAGCVSRTCIGIA